MIKLPKVLELVGPTTMSYLAISYTHYRLTEHGEGKPLKFTYQAMALFPSEVPADVSEA